MRRQRELRAAAGDRRQKTRSGHGKKESQGKLKPRAKIKDEKQARPNLLQESESRNNSEMKTDLGRRKRKHEVQLLNEWKLFGRRIPRQTRRKENEL
jgi:hypothetical protein